jgi:hypothetical protein
MKVESKLIVIPAAAASGFSAPTSPSRLPTCSVWLRNVLGLLPASIGSRCCNTSAATRYGISAESRACSWFSSGVDRHRFRHNHRQHTPAGEASPDFTEQRRNPATLPIFYATPFAA